MEEVSVVEEDVLTALLRGWRCRRNAGRQFIDALRGHVVGERQIAEACEGARWAFDSLIALNEVTGRYYE